MENEIEFDKLFDFCKSINHWRKEYYGSHMMEDHVTKYKFTFPNNISIEVRKNNCDRGFSINYFLLAYNKDVEIARFGNGHTDEILKLYKKIEKKYETEKKKGTELVKKKGVSLLKNMLNDYL